MAVILRYKKDTSYLRKLNVTRLLLPAFTPFATLLSYVHSLSALRPVMRFLLSTNQRSLSAGACHGCLDMGLLSMELMKMWNVDSLCEKTMMLDDTA